MMMSLRTSLQARGLARTTSEAVRQEIHGISDHMVLVFDIVHNFTKRRAWNSGHLGCVQNIIDACHHDDRPEPRRPFL